MRNGKVSIFLWCVYKNTSGLATPYFNVKDAVRDASTLEQFQTCKFAISAAFSPYVFKRHL